jgi:amino acid permease
MQTALIFFTNQVGIGILSLPAMLHTIGLIPGIITSESGRICAW